MLFLRHENWGEAGLPTIPILERGGGEELENLGGGRGVKFGALPGA